MFNSSAFVIAGTVVSVGAAAAGTAISASAANKAAAAQGRAGKESIKAQQKAAQEAQQRLAQATAQLGGSLSKITPPQWNVARDIKEAGQITDYSLGQLEKIFPGAKSQREIAARATKSYLRGEIPKDVQNQIMRSVAELGGAGFRPTEEGVPQAGGFQAAQGLLARQLGLTSLDLQLRGQDLSQSWQRLAGAYIESPLQVGQARLQYEQAGANLEMQKAAAIYNAQAAEANLGYSAGINIANAAYGIQTQGIGARLAASQALGSGISSIGQALGGGLTSYGMAGALTTARATELAGATAAGTIAQQQAQAGAASSPTWAARGGGGLMLAERAPTAAPAGTASIGALRSAY